MNKPISKSDVQNIQIMLSKGVKKADIARIVNVSQSTVERVRNGTHVLLQQNKRCEVKPTQEPKPKEIEDNDIEQKLDTIIELLKDIKQLRS